mmetsp:Transcript_30015/g.69901  ORF Transcript_30015/g.69901 Transcript_30015/m.69901 type:complete len:420 (+) Transcript_30015:75-1334(+)
MSLPDSTVAAERQIVVVAMNGEELLRMSSTELLQDTDCRELLQRVSKAVGFAKSSLSLTTSGGQALFDSDPVSKVLESEAGESVYLTCILSPVKPIAAKEENDRRFGRKGVLLLTKRLQAAAKGGAFAQICRAPELGCRNEVLDLLSSSFAPDLKPLIDAGLQAAFGEEGGNAATDSDAPYIYKHEATGTSADLSSCRLWISEFQSSLVGAVLWRVIDGWSGADSDAFVEGREIGAGPVLEVLFLAIQVGLREHGQAGRLLSELESTARQMGCVAVTVAAVPHQGCAFWTSNGYRVAVPCTDGPLESPDAAQEPGPFLDATTGAFGQYLFRHMLLFTDTPLMAKVLSDAAPSPPTETDKPEEPEAKEEVDGSRRGPPLLGDTEEQPEHIENRERRQSSDNQNPLHRLWVWFEQKRTMIY